MDRPIPLQQVFQYHHYHHYLQHGKYCLNLSEFTSILQLICGLDFATWSQKLSRSETTDAILYSILIPNLLFVVSVVILVYWLEPHAAILLCLGRKSLSKLIFCQTSLITSKHCTSKSFGKMEQLGMLPPKKRENGKISTFPFSLGGRGASLMSHKKSQKMWFVGANYLNLIEKKTYKIFQLYIYGSWMIYKRLLWLKSATCGLRIHFWSTCDCGIQLCIAFWKYHWKRREKKTNPQKLCQTKLWIIKKMWIRPNNMNSTNMIIYVS